jgi:hypothetical protein
MQHIPIFAFDFSMNKPAMACLIEYNLYFNVWPLNIDKISENKLNNVQVKVYNRQLSPIKDKKMNENTLICEHVTRAKSLSNLILNDILEILNIYNINADVCYVSNEGFSFGSKGDAILDLSGYKYILMSTLIDNGFKNLRTYSPITLKKTAGCSKKGMKKLDMINAISNEDVNLHPFIKTLHDNPDSLKKKTAFVQCVDDITDAYWCLQTTIEKEKIEL